MKNKRTIPAVIVAMAAAFVITPIARADGSILKRGDVVAMAGDSITYMSRDSVWDLTPAKPFA